MSKKLVYLFIALALLSFASCINYDNEITLNNDGSGKIHIHYWMAESMYNMMKGQPPKEGEAPKADPFSEEEVAKSYQGEGLKVSGFKTFKDEEKEPNRHVELDVSFTNIANLSNCKEFEKWVFQFEAKDTIVFSAVLPPEPKPDKEMTEEEKKSAKSASDMLAGYSYTMTIKFPGKVLESSGTIDTEDPTKVKWTTTMSAKNDEGMNLTATVEKGKGGGGPLPLIIFGGFIVVIIIIAIVAGGKKKGAPEVVTEEVPGDE